MKQRLLGLLLAVCALPAMAEDRFTAEILLGTADQKSTAKFDGVTSSISGDDLSVGIRGAFSLNRYLALELAYHNYGEIDESYIDEFGDSINDKVSATAFNAGVKGILPFDNGISLYGRAGVSFWDVEARSTDSYFPGEVFKVDDDGSDAYVGIGLQYNLTPKLIIGAEYTITTMGLSVEGISVDHEVKNLSLSLGYRF